MQIELLLENCYGFLGLVGFSDALTELLEENRLLCVLMC
jgi:hypothetical protein